VSYDIWLEIDAGGPEPLHIGYWNYTSNCAAMWKAAGIDLALCAVRDAGGCAEGLAGAIANLRADPTRFRTMDPPNGWGSYDTLIPALEELLELFESAPKARVGIWR